MASQKRVIDYWREGQALRAKEPKKNFGWVYFLIGLLIGLFLFSLANAEPADETLNYKPVAVGMGFLLAPICLTGDSNGLDWGHAIELEGFSYAETDIIADFLPKDLKFFAPIISFEINTLYRMTELQGKPGDYLVFKKMIADDMGIAGWTVLKIKF